LNDLLLNVLISSRSLPYGG